MKETPGAWQRRGDFGVQTQANNKQGDGPEGANPLRRWRSITAAGCSALDWLKFCDPGKAEMKLVGGADFQSPY